MTEEEKPRRWMRIWIVTAAILSPFILAQWLPNNTSSSASSTMSVENPRIDFLRWKPWPDYRNLPPEAFDAVAGIINQKGSPYYCPDVIEARAIGLGEFGNEILAFCTTGTFGIHIKPDTGEIRVGPR